MPEKNEMDKNNQSSEILINFEDDQFEQDTFDMSEQNNEKEALKSKRKRNKKKKSQNKNRISETNEHEHLNENKSNQENVEIDYVQETIDIDRKDPSYTEFCRIFDYFKIVENTKSKDENNDANLTLNPDKSKTSESERLKYNILADEDDDNERQDKINSVTDGQQKLSKKQLKKQHRLSVAELKQLVNRPDVVEMHDITARDPKLLVHLKATRNTVPVPRHWCAKRKYLQGKRGIEKPAFDLPDFIKRTGITEMRQALHEKEDKKSLKQKMREKIRPKMGKIDIEYQKLHDAFFRYQTKPRMSIHGDLYYEGKEFETKLKEKKPGNLSDDLRIALGMPTGSNADKVPPPWLIAMQRYGPPPSYPNLRIPGLNAPIPENCSFGYHAGGWGKPPVDEFGRPLYGDVFGASLGDVKKSDEDEHIERSYWGELEKEEIEDEEPFEEPSEDENEKEDESSLNEEIVTSGTANTFSGVKTPGEGLMTPSGISTSVSAGLETPDMIELRKKKIESEMEGNETPALFKVLPEVSVSVGATMMGSTKVYDVSAAKKLPSIDSSISGGVDVFLNPDELDMDSEVIQARYNQQIKEQSVVEKEDLSDMVADHAAKQTKKRKKQQTTSSNVSQEKDKSSKRVKEFKF